MVIFLTVVGVLVLERAIELRIASTNFTRLIAKGGREIGEAHYGWIVALHIGFFASLLVEYVLRAPALPAAWPLCAMVLIMAQVIRLWVLLTLRSRWTTRVIVLPNERLVATGPYKFLRHPNYIVVALELLSLPLLFGLYWTAAIFTLLNAVLLLGLRIPIEERALRQYAGHLPRSQ